MPAYIRARTVQSGRRYDVDLSTYTHVVPVEEIEAHRLEALLR